MARAMTVEQLGQAVAQALGPRLVAFLLYGSAARGGTAHVPGRSDLNTLLICDAADDTLFAALASVVARWRKAGQPAPLILTEREWRESADAFPIEYDDIRHAHRLLAGRDPWGGITVRREDLRRQLEHELKGKVIRLRQACAALREDPKALAAALAGSVAGFFTMLRSTLRLAGRTAPAAPDELVREAGAVVGFPAESVRDVVAHAQGRVKMKLVAGDPRAAAYVWAVTRTAEFVNQL